MLFPTKNYLYLQLLWVHIRRISLYSLEMSQWGTSNEYPQHMLSSRNKKNYLPDTHSYLDLWICYDPFGMTWHLSQYGIQFIPSLIRLPGSGWGAPSDKFSLNILRITCKSLCETEPFTLSNFAVISVCTSDTSGSKINLRSIWKVSGSRTWLRTMYVSSSLDSLALE